MHDAPRYDPFEASAVLPKGALGAADRRRHRGARAPAEDELLYTGKVERPSRRHVPVRDHARRPRPRPGALQHLLRAVPRPYAAKVTAWSCSAATGRPRRTTSIGCARPRPDISSTSSPTASARCRTTGADSGRRPVAHRGLRPRAADESSRDVRRCARDRGREDGRPGDPAPAEPQARPRDTGADDARSGPSEAGDDGSGRTAEIGKPQHAALIMGAVGLALASAAGYVTPATRSGSRTSSPTSSGSASRWARSPC